MRKGEAALLVLAVSATCISASVVGTNTAAQSISAERIAKLPVAGAILYMMTLDVSRIFQVARLRRHALGGMESIGALGGILRTRHREMERAIAAAREEASLSKRILFLSSTQKLFHLWHVVHKPFSYTFAILAVLHIGLQLLLGYY